VYGNNRTQVCKGGDAEEVGTKQRNPGPHKMKLGRKEKLGGTGLSITVELGQKCVLNGGWQKDRREKAESRLSFNGSSTKKDSKGRIRRNNERKSNPTIKKQSVEGKNRRTLIAEQSRKNAKSFRANSTRKADTRLVPQAPGDVASGASTTGRETVRTAPIATRRVVCKKERGPNHSRSKSGNQGGI